jgi:hypothetical protein
MREQSTRARKRRGWFERETLGPKGKITFDRLVQVREDLGFG